MPLYITTVTSIAMVKPGNRIWPWTCRGKFIRAKDKGNGRMTLVPTAHLRSVEAFDDEDWLEFMRKESAHREEHRKLTEEARKKAAELNPKAAARKQVVFKDGC
jgi:hypothetical protein